VSIGGSRPNAKENAANKSISFSSNETKTSTIEKIPESCRIPLEALWDDEWEKTSSMPRSKGEAQSRSEASITLRPLRHQEWPIRKITSTVR